MASLWTDQQAGPASYPTGGFVVVTSLATVACFDVWIDTAGPNLPAVNFVYTLNSPSAGSVTVKVMRETYQLLTALGSPTGQPAGVSTPTTSGSLVNTETPHSHAIDHDHAISGPSSLMSGGSGLVTQEALSPVNTSAHTHTVDLANFVGTSGTATHQHTWNSIYSHQHTVTNTTTDAALTELANATNLAGATFNYIGSDS